ncbi:NrfD/PsrC family molybdoenzyme membrane anchor subunit [Blastococcus sp. CCUG 61487]|uniref:NrfD/PsrC family molybdoenzyme membrane anchor subunit n=1 Tax=Blastococcus sp. CCUG 61487 TaxID=1840703 RepID=UPI0010C0348E|nr:NrfD/PsrC family molybdoenzyme membrane anchor subunit [Blastococcus sp. CCUG 61487]TKJ23137.1 nitrite reductase [Blastococcus sp. CCUG 61487]
MTEGLVTPGAGWRRADGWVGKKKGDGRRRRSGRRAVGEQSMVDDAEFTSYYDRPIIKAPVWKTPDVPLYLFLGGAAGTSAVLAALGDLSGRPALTRAGRLIAGGSAVSSVGWLIHDLGRPERFLHMLRVMKPTSALSVGSYILAPFSAAAGATAAVELLGWFPRLKRFGGFVAGLFGPPMATYTAVLFANTAVPSWRDFSTRLPYVFAGSAMAAGGGLCLVFTPTDESEPARKMAILGAGIELAALRTVEGSDELAAEPYHEGKAGTLMRAARASTASGLGLAVVGGRTRLGAIASGALLAAGSLLTRFGVYEAGMASARDPKYTVVPQRERLAAGTHEHASTITR